MVVTPTDIDVLLTVHLSIFISVNNQLDTQNLCYNKFISCLYMFQAHGASSWLITKIKPTDNYKRLSASSIRVVHCT